ncbi:MAG: lipoprotein-releasing ABC transporter permease subunit [Caulobacter sp.]|nr:lipoprotein-releasing ABC transporter permease subunit [Caulobacter sp.]
MADRAPPFSLWERALAGRYLRARRKDAGVALISILAFLGITAAVFALIVVMSVMNGFRTELLSRILGFNGHLYVAGAPLSDQQRAETVKRLRAVPGVTQVTAMVEAQAMVIGRGQISGAIVRGVSREDVKSTKIVADNIKPGSIEGYGEGEYGGDLILLGQRLALSLGVGPGDAVSLISPSGSTSAFGVSAAQKDYTVGGLFAVGMSEYDQAFAYMPLEQAQLFFGKEGSVDVIEVKLTDPDEAPDMKAEIARAAGPGAIVTDWTEKNQSFFNALQIERNVMRLILMFIVVIAAINIISGLIMLVKTKGRDIAILRTMGASRAGILRVFFMSGAAIGVAGTLAGLVLGVLFCLNIAGIQHLVERVTGAEVFNADVYFLTHIPARIEWREVAMITGWSLLVSFLATLPPALRAARLDPVEALRYE